MSAVIPTPSQCCEPCVDECVPVQVPGPAGANGANGTNGTNGVNAFMTLAANFTMPAEGASSIAGTTTNSAFSVGQVVYVGALGYMGIVAKPTTTTTTLSNLENTATNEYVGNAAPGTIAGSGNLISPAGVQGPAGSLSGAAGGQLKGTYPNPDIGIANALGSLIVGDSADAQELAVGADGSRLVADGTQALGMRWAKVDLEVAAGEVVNALEVPNGGTGLAAGVDGGVPFFNTANVMQSSALLAEFIPIVGGGTGAGGPRTIASAGTAGQVLTSNGAAADPTYQASSASGIPKQMVLIQEQRTNGTPSSVALSSYRQLNTIVQDDTGAVSVTTSGAAWGQFTLPAGTWRVRARAPNTTGAHQLVLYNLTAGANLLIGASMPATHDSWVFGRFTIAATTTLCLMTMIAAAAGGSSAAASNGITEIYSQIWLEKEL